MPKNPADVQRKLERKRELQRNKKQREQSREVMQMRNDPARMREELLRLEQLERAGNLDNAMRPAKLRLAEAYRQALLRNPNAAETKAAPAAVAAAAKTLAEPPKKKKTAAAAAVAVPTTATATTEEGFFEDAREIAETAAALSSGMVPLALRVKRQRPLTAAAAAEPRVPSSSSSDDAPTKTTEDSTGGEDKEMEAFMAEMREIGAIE